MWFIAGNVLRDLASLNKMEMLPWDVWGLMEMNDEAITDDKKALLDRVAALTLADDDAFAEVRAIYESDDRLRVPPVVFNALRNAPEPIAAGWFVRDTDTAEPAQSPFPLSGITWFAFPALSKIVTLRGFRAPPESGPNCNVSLHFFFGKSWAPQSRADRFEFLRGLAGGTTVIGLPKVIGGPFFA